MVVHWNEISLIDVRYCVLRQHVHFERVDLLCLHTVTSEVDSLLRPLISFAIKFNELTEGIPVHKVALSAVAVVCCELPLVAISLSIFKLALLDLHYPILLLGIKCRVVISKLVLAKTPIVHEPAKSSQGISDIVKQNKLVSVGKKHLALPVTDV